MPDLTFPGEPVQARDLEGAARRKAESVCREAGVTDPINFENCVLDVGLTGDEEFAEIASEQPLALTRLELRPTQGPGKEQEAASKGGMLSSIAAGISLTTASKALASFPFEVEVRGPATPDYVVVIVPAGSPNHEKAGAVRLSGGPQQTVKLIAPTESGAYEVRYTTRGSRKEVLIRLPVEIIDPVATIEAPESAPAGGKIPVRCVGECSPHANLTVVPVGSPDTLMGAHAYLSGRPEVTIYRLPKEPGQYEIRYVTRRQPRRVFARKPLRIE